LISILTFTKVNKVVLVVENHVVFSKVTSYL